jgi:beta-adrenergic-receptor kinase
VPGSTGNNDAPEPPENRNPRLVRNIVGAAASARNASSSSSSSTAAASATAGGGTSGGDGEGSNRFATTWREYVLPPLDPPAPIISATLGSPSQKVINHSLTATIPIMAPVDVPATSKSAAASDQATSNAIRIRGAPLERVLAVIESLKNPASPQGSKSKSSLPETFNYQLFDELDEIIFLKLKDQHWAPFQVSPTWTKYIECLTQTERRVTEDDFTLLRVVGRGGFGMVNGCKRATTGHLYAMKMMNKKRVKMKKAENLCLNERNLMAAVDSPYVVCLKYAFATQSDLYLILDLMTGGDLGFHLARKGRFTDRESKYYSARTLLGIAALHEQNIVYRDLKPENILMGEDGRSRISDLGLAQKVGKSGTSGTCGTRGYWAPEMLKRDEAGKRERYTLAVDWFSFGCVLFEFVYGSSPFRTERARQWGDFPKVDKADKDRAIDLAIKEMEPEFDPSFFEPRLRDLIQKLLIKDGKARLGARGPQEIMSHPWYSDIDWSNLDYVTPPMKPAKDINTSTQSEIGTFSDEKSSKKIELLESDHKIYDKWDFINPRAFEEEVVEFFIFEEVLVSERYKVRPILKSDT